MQLSLRQVCKKVGNQFHIADVSLTFTAGTLNILLGPTLSGKTSLMRLMAGLDRPTSGSIHVDDRDVTGVPVQKRNVAMVYQQFINYPNLKVYENIASPLRLARLPKHEIETDESTKSPSCSSWRRCCTARRWNCPAASSNEPPWPGPWTSSSSASSTSDRPTPCP
jgi:ABC-type sugar transport system ATPase subunit